MVKKKKKYHDEKKYGRLQISRLTKSADVYTFKKKLSSMYKIYLKRYIVMSKCFLLFVVQNYDVAFTWKYKIDKIMSKQFVCRSKL